MYLNRGGEVVVGVFYYTENWVPFILGGSWVEGGAIKVGAKPDQDGAEVGQLAGRLTTKGLVGTWKQVGDNIAVPVHLKTVPQPSCDGKGPWKRFNDPRWPITFSYPASWRVTTDPDGTTISCPDPSLMAYDGFALQLSQGKRTDLELTGFVDCGGQWRQGSDCDCDRHDQVLCQVATVDQRNGMTILGGEAGEWRVYCRGGGYVALGEGDERLILIDDKWVRFYEEGLDSQIVERIARTIKGRR